MNKIFHLCKIPTPCYMLQNFIATVTATSYSLDIGYTFHKSSRDTKVTTSL